MKLRLSVLAMMAVAPSLANAAALDRSGQSISPFFEKGNYAELSYVAIDPDLPGKTAAGKIDGKAAGEHSFTSAALKFSPNDSTAVAVIYDQPWGVDYDYKDTMPAPLAGLETFNAKVKSENVTTLVGSKVLSNVWLYAGLAFEDTNATVNTAINFEDSGVGYVGGFAFEKPEIALRAAVTYRSEVEMSNPSAAIAAYSTPQNVNFNFQTGISPTTLLMFDARWVNWASFAVNTKATARAVNPRLPKTIVKYDDDQISGSIGIGHKFTNNFSGLAKVGYDTGSGDIISVFGPYKDKTSVTLAGKYKFNKSVDATLGVSYIMLGEAKTSFPTPTGGVAAEFEDGKAIAIGGKIGYHF